MPTGAQTPVRLCHTLALKATTACFKVIYPRIALEKQQTHTKLAPAQDSSRIKCHRPTAKLTWDWKNVIKQYTAHSRLEKHLMYWLYLECSHRIEW
jgi:hypothetical protein